MMEVGKFTSLGSLFDQSSRFIFYLCMIISMYKGDGNLQLVGDKLRIFFFTKYCCQFLSRLYSIPSRNWVTDSHTYVR